MIRLVIADQHRSLPNCHLSRPETPLYVTKLVESLGRTRTGRLTRSAASVVDVSGTPPESPLKPNAQHPATLAAGSPPGRAPLLTKAFGGIPADRLPASAVPSSPSRAACPRALRRRNPATRRCRPGGLPAITDAETASAVGQQSAGP